MNILLVEDDQALAKGLQQALNHEHFVVNAVSKGKDALHVIDSDKPDIIILDVGLPDMDGFQVLKQLRLKDADLPVLLLTARDSVNDKVEGLDLGADDYLTKPFDMQELLARLRMLGRRSGTSSSSVTTIGSVSLDSASHNASCEGKVIELPRREYMLLQALMENAGRVQTRDNLETKLYSWGEEVSSNSIQVHIHNLRKKLVPDFITTIRGIGYIVKKS
jgi:DNA-binding response OmpR family regulator